MSEEKRDFHIPYDVIVEALHALKDSDNFTNTVQKLTRSKQTRQAAYNVHAKVSSAYDSMLSAVSFDNTRI